MRMLKQIFYLALLLLFAKITMAQQEYTLHFSRNLVQSMHTNPAIKQDYKIGIALPSVVFNFGNNAFSYNDLVRQHPIYDSTYLDIDGVIKNMTDNNILQVQSQLEIFGIYFTIRKWYASIYFSEKLDMRLTYPKELVDVMWNGNAKYIGQTVNIGPGLKFNYYKELKLGLGRSMGKWDVGVNAKVLFGMANFHSVRNDLLLTTGEDNYGITLNTDYQINTSGTTDPLENLLRIPKSRLNPGFALDIGGIYHHNDKWEFSQSFLNLGAIKWKNDVKTYISNGSFTFSGVDINDFIDQDDVNFDEYTDSLRDLYFEERQGGFYWSNLSPESYTSVLFTPDEKTNIGIMMHLMQFNGMQYGFTVYAGRNLMQFVDLGFSWSYKNRRYDNVGFNLALGPKEYKIFVVTDNLLTFLNARKGRNVTFRYGMNINLGHAKLGMRKKDKSEPEVIETAE